MIQKFIFLLLSLGFVTQSCNNNQNTTNNASNKTNADSASVQNLDNEVGKRPDLSGLPCVYLVKRDTTKTFQNIYADTMTVFNTPLLFVTRDSALLVFAQSQMDCTFLLKIPIDSTDLYTYTDGSPVFLEDMNGDNQKEVLVTVSKNKGHYSFRVYRLVKENDRIVLKKMPRFEELINPEFNAKTNMIRVHWFESDNYELDESYTISKDDALIFVKGMERKGDKVRTYATKDKW